MNKIERTPKMVLKKVDTFNPEYYSLAEILKEVKQLIKEYGKDATISEFTHAYSEDTYLAVMARVMETEKECADRVAKEEKWAKECEERDRADFDRLQKKFKDVK